MGELMSMHMWSERRQEIRDDTKKMVVQLAGMYKTAYSYYILKQLRKDLTARNKQPMLLAQRKWQSYSRPLQAGPLYVMGTSEHRKWRRRYCVLQPDYTLEVYDTEEDFEIGNRPRFSRKHSSFKVIDNVDAHISQSIKDYLRDFGYITQNVSHVMKKLGSLADPSKRPTQHVLALAHPYRGTFFMAADTAVEKEKWLNSMQDAARQLSGVHCDSELQRDAFNFAIAQACDAQEHCGIKVIMSGTQEEIVTDFITDYLANGCRTMLQTKVKGNLIRKYKMWNMISKHLSMLVESIVQIHYPPERKKAEEQSEQLQPKMMASMPRIVAVYDTASAEITAAIEPGFRDELEEKILSKLPELVTKMADAMSGSLREVRDIFVSLAESVQRQVNGSSTKFANNIDRFFLSHLDLAPRNPEVMQNLFKATLGSKSPLKALGEAFPKLGYSSYEEQLCVCLQKLLDSTLCTFEILCGEAVHKNNGQLEVTNIAKIQGRVLKKLGHDNRLMVKNFLQDMMLTITFKILRHTVDSEAKNKMREFEDFIPAEFAEFMPIANVFRDAVMNRFMEEIHSGLAVGFKRLSNDHFSMARYQSCSTIDSRLSGCSGTYDEIPSSSKQGSLTSHANSSRASPVLRTTPKVPSEDEGEKEENSEGVPEGEEVGESVSSNHTPSSSSETEDEDVQLAGAVMDGETGEIFKVKDENGEDVVVVKDPTEDPEYQEEYSGFLSGATNPEVVNGADPVELSRSDSESHNSEIPQEPQDEESSHPPTCQEAGQSQKCHEKSNGSIEVHSNGVAKHESKPDRQIEGEPPTPAPRKNRTQSATPSSPTQDTSDRLGGGVVDPDIEKYNGVLEQIIQSGEEKLI